jgi:hypothetical protein
MTGEELELKPKFAVGDFAIGKRPGCSRLVSIDEVAEQPEGAFIYSVKFRDAKTFRSGGGSLWWDEDCFEPITDPVLLLKIERFKKLQQITELSKKMGELKIDLAHLDYALAIYSELRR